MNTIRPRSLIPLVAAAIGLGATAASAATTLPYLGPDQQNCGITQPKDLEAIDAGYIPSEDCRFIYVLPPSKGIFEAYQPVYTNAAAEECGYIQDTLAQMRKPAVPESDPRYRQAQMQAAQEVANFRNLITDMYTGPHAVVSASASLQWNQLIRAYQRANPLSVSQFIAMPVRVGALSMAGADARIGTLGEFENELYSVEVSRYVPPASSATLDTNEAPLYLSFLREDKSSVLMGQSVGMQLRLGMFQACQLRRAPQPEQYLSGTYTYVFPIQTKGYVTFKFEKELLTNEIRKFIEERRDAFTTDDLLAHVRQKGVFSVEMNSGYVPNRGIDEKLEEFKTELGARAVEVLLGVLAQQTAVSMRAATYEYLQEHRQQVCRRFLFMKRCQTHVWHTAHTRVDWVRFAADLSRNLNVPDLSAQTYRTFFMMSTSAIVPSKGAIQ